MSKTKIKAVAEHRRRLVLVKLKLQAEIREINAILNDIEKMKGGVKNDGRRKID